MTSAPRSPLLPLTTTFVQPSRRHRPAMYVSKSCHDRASTSAIDSSRARASSCARHLRSWSTARRCERSSIQPAPAATTAASTAMKTGHTIVQCPATHTTTAAATTAPQPCTCRRVRFLNRQRRRRDAITPPLSKTVNRNTEAYSVGSWASPYRPGTMPEPASPSVHGLRDATCELTQEIEDSLPRRGRGDEYAQRQNDGHGVHFSSNRLRDSVRLRSRNKTITTSSTPPLIVNNRPDPRNDPPPHPYGQQRATPGFLCIRARAALEASCERMA